MPTLANNENEIFKISSSVTKVFEYNHEEDDTRIIFHALQQRADVVVCLKDTNALLLLVFAYALTKIKEMQMIKIESRKCISIRKIVEYLALTSQQSFLKFMQLQSATQHLFYIVFRKLKFLKVSTWIKKLRLLNTITAPWKVSETVVKDVEKFIQTVCYSGKEEESLTETRVRLYKQMETKTFQFIPPDEKSMLQAIKFIHYEVYYW